MFNNIKQKIIYIFKNRNESIFKKYFYLFFEDYFFKKKKLFKNIFLYFKFWGSKILLLKYFLFWSKLLIIVEAFLQDVLSFYLIQIQPKIQEVHKLLVDES